MYIILTKQKRNMLQEGEGKGKGEGKGWKRERGRGRGELCFLEGFRLSGWHHSQGCPSHDHTQQRLLNHTLH